MKERNKKTLTKKTDNKEPAMSLTGNQPDANQPDVNQTKFPEFLQDVKTVQSPEILDIGNLSECLNKATVYIRKEVGTVSKSFCRIVMLVIGGNRGD